MVQEHKIVAIVQARMGSSRLPGKVAKEIVGKPMLAHLINRLKRAENLNQIVIATSKEKADDRVVEIAKREGVDFYRGSETDVLSRYIEAAQKFGADVIIRITGDCPLIDPVTVDEVIADFLKSEVDYMGHRGYPRGLDTEVFYLETLLRVKELLSDDKKDDLYREHVTLYIYRHPEIFNIAHHQAPEVLRRDYRLCVDEIDDFRLVKEIYERLYREDKVFDIKETIKLLDQEPELARLNSHVQQKKYI
ncbi:MAG: spore coat polysaccharide biosynthesis protein SpsF [Halanaerobiales bacterium]|nr:spore coat polysaccharide biosynthesis protein SpsF [Halanaerobiales bacterium]